MIASIEQFLSAYNENAAAEISFDWGDTGYFYGDSLVPGKTEVDPDLIRRLEFLGVLYVYSGQLKINPMAMRILERIQAAGAPVSESALRREIKLSKELYAAERHDSELERA